MELPSADQIRKVIDYSPETGVFTWAMKTGRKVVVGKRAGFVMQTGYIQVGVLGFKITGHRLAWVHYYGEWPEGPLDHVNGVRSDNRIANLRKCTNAENRQNRTFRSTNASGHIGVYITRHGTYQAKIGIDGVMVCLGAYKTKDEAIEKYLEAKAVLHKFSPTVNNGPIYAKGKTCN